LQPAFSGAHLLWTLYFLKTSSSSSRESLSSRFGVKDERTMKKWIWYTLCLLDTVLPPFDFNDRWEEWTRSVPSFLLRTTSVPMRGPHSRLEYEFACSLGVPRVIHVSSPRPAAAAAAGADRAVSEDLEEKMLPGECGVGDKVHPRDGISRRLVPLPGRKRMWSMEEEDLTRSCEVPAVRQTIERVVNRVEQFGVVELPWRWGIEFHAKCFAVVCKLCNLSLIYEALG
jgi:hypothetical protein